MDRSRYPSDLTDEQWAVLAPQLLREYDGPGRPIDAERLREYLNAISHVFRAGCPVAAPAPRLRRRLIFGASAVLRWTRRGVWDGVLVNLREAARLSAGRAAKPSGAVVDSSSVKASPVTGPTRIRRSQEDRRNQTAHPHRHHRHAPGR